MIGVRVRLDELPDVEVDAIVPDGRHLEADVDGERRLMRSPLKGCAGEVLAAARVMAPPVALPIAAAS